MKTQFLTAKLSQAFLVAGITTFPSMLAPLAQATVPASIQATNQLQGTVLAQRGDFYPGSYFPPTLSISPSSRALAVQGFGSANVPADTAIIRLLFNPSASTRPVPVPPRSTTSRPISRPAPAPARPTSVQPTQNELKPVVDALVKAGVPRNNIEVNVRTAGVEIPTYIKVNLNKPTRNQVQQMVNTASTAASKTGKMSIQNVGVQYLVNDCQSLENAARLDAANDASAKARSLADAMKVQLGNVLFVTESPAASPYAPFEACSSFFNKANFPPDFFPYSYNPATPAEVQVTRNVLVTYEVR